MQNGGLSESRRTLATATPPTRRRRESRDGSDTINRVPWSGAALAASGPIDHAVDVIEVFSGQGVWDQLEGHLDGGERRSAAIAYIGSRANDWLRLGRGDVLIFDGDDKSIKQNHVDLAVIGKLMKAGVLLFSQPGLHAKVMVIESTKPKAIVGSANASVTSVHDKAEAVVVVNDRAAVEDVRAAVAGWRVGLAPLTPTWLARVEKLPRGKRTPATKFNPSTNQPLSDPTKPLWLLNYEWSEEEWEDDVTTAVSMSMQEKGYVVDAFPLRTRAAIYRQIKKDHSVLFVPFPSTANKPRSNAEVTEPYLVLEKLPRGRGGDILIGSRSSAIAHRWDEVQAAINDAGSSSEEGLLDDAGRAAVCDLFCEGSTA